MAELTLRQRWFRPPRPHGDVDRERSVSFLELFYDLVFVLLIAEMAHTLAEHVSWTGVRDFAVLFGLVWFAWVNGTLYHDLHGGEDGRSRTYIFMQMMVLVVLAVFIGHATDDPGDSRAFAVVYAILLLVIAGQWFDVLRRDTPEWRRVATGYFVAIVAVAAVVAGTALLDDVTTRVLIWTGTVVVMLAANTFVSLRPADEEMSQAIDPTESLVERFGLFTIIVLGEVVVGVAAGISAAEHSVVTFVTGLLALQVGFGMWWNYFDLVGGRSPRSGHPRVPWLFTHLPLAAAISAVGAGMTSLIEHAGDVRTPAPTAWLLGGATALFLLSLVVIVRTLEPHPGRTAVPMTMSAAAVAALAIAAVRPAPWALAAVLLLLLGSVWLETFLRHARHGTTITERAPQEQPGIEA